MKTILALIACGLVACHPRAVVIEPIAPQVSKAKASVVAASKTADRVKVEAAEVHKEAKEFAASVALATAEVEALKSKLPGQVDVLASILVEMGHKAATHIKSTGSLSGVATVGSGEIKAAVVEIAGVEKASIQQDKAFVAVAADRDKLAVKASKWDSHILKRWLLGGGIVVALGLFVFFRYGAAIAARFVKPI